MIKLSSRIIVCSLAIALTSCSTIKSQEPVDLLKNKTTHSSNQPPLIKPSCPPPKKKNPLNVSLYKSGVKPAQHYKVLGQESISKYNQSGIKRQKANIHDLMRTMAAMMGGDAVINLKYDKKIVSGTVISFEKMA